MTPTLKAKLREELGSLTSDAKLDRVYRAVLEGIREDMASRDHAHTVSGVMEWRPIDTAPYEKLPLGDDGDFTTWTPWMLVGHRIEGGHWVSWVGILSADDWLGRNDAAACFETEKPTHWMPLADPPTLLSQGEAVE